jgi:hypothetical protein
MLSPFFVSPRVYPRGPGSGLRVQYPTIVLLVYTYLFNRRYTALVVGLYLPALPTLIVNPMGAYFVATITILVVDAVRHI